MKKHFKRFLACLLFLAILVGSLWVINRILVPKYTLYNSEYPTTSTYEQFYRMERNSVDVLFLGSSLVVNGIIPQEIYNSYGIRSYNLGCEQQSIFLSYYWLKEALRYQSPKAVVLELAFMVSEHPEDAINTTEGLTRKCLDPMRLSPVKREAVHRLCQLNPSQSELSYYLTNLRFHARWPDLKEQDFVGDPAQPSQLMGFAPSHNPAPDSFHCYVQKDPDVKTEFDDVMQECLDQITELCSQEGIHLILFCMPGGALTDEINNTHAAYAAENGLLFLNLSTEEAYRDIGAVLPDESVVGHSNLAGARKLSRYMGRQLQKAAGIKSVQDIQYESSRAYYDRILKNEALRLVSDSERWLREVRDPNYVVMVSAFMGLPDFSKDTSAALQDLGLRVNAEAFPYSSYLAVIEGGTVAEESTSQEALSLARGLRNGHSTISLESRGAMAGTSSSITIDGTEYANSSRGVPGLNFVVFDTVTMRVIDSVMLRGDGLLR